MRSGFAQRNYLSMAKWIMVTLSGVVAAANYVTIGVEDNSTHWNVALSRSLLG